MPRTILGSKRLIPGVGTGSVGCKELNGKELRPRERGIKDAQSKSGNFLGCKMSFDEVVKDPVNIKTTS